MSRLASVLLALGMTLATGACAKPQAAPTEPAPLPAPAPAEGAIAAAIAAPDRTPEDRAEDEHRKPEAFLRFVGVAPGMRVVDLAAGGGYMLELLARVVGPEGTIFGHNTQESLDKYVKDAWPARLGRPACANVVPMILPITAPFSPEAKNLDIVTFGFIYHDTVWMGVDRKAMNAAVFAALKPGGVYVIADHAAGAGRGVQDVETLHRIEKQAVIDEVTQAGFVLDGESDLYANPDDPHDGNVFGELRGRTDRFILRFKKP